MESTENPSDFYDKLSNNKYNGKNNHNKKTKDENKKKKNFDSDKKSLFINLPIEDHGFLSNYCLLCEEIKSASLEHFHPVTILKEA